MIQKKINKIYILTLLIFFLGIFLRYIQLNFESYWLDEMISFWIADPDLSLKQTVMRNSYMGQTPPLFDLILKYFFLIFSYDPYIGRYLTFFLGVISILLLTYLSLELNKNYSYLLVLFIVSTNIYLISYSQEVRPYILVFLLSIINILLYFRLNHFTENYIKKFLLFFCFIVISILTYSTHPFALIILFSQIFHSLILKVFFKRNIRTFLIFLPIILIFYLMFNYKYLLEQLSYDEYFLDYENWKFYYNYYFSRFFGSRIMGILYLSILIFLILRLKKIVFIKNEKYLFLFILLIFSYLIPLSYGLLKTPVLTDRYIIFVMIPILLLITNLVFEVKKIKLKLFLILLIIIPTTINAYIEIKYRVIFKPQFDLFFKDIKNDETNNFLILGPDKLILLIENYIRSLSDFKKVKYQIIEKTNKLSVGSKFWVICYEPINDFDCKKLNFTNNKFIALEEKQYHLLNSAKYQIK
jgi:hypothetical protein